MAVKKDLGAEIHAVIEQHGLVNVLGTLSRIVGANERKAEIDNAEAKTWSLACNAIEHAHTIILYHFDV